MFIGYSETETTSDSIRPKSFPFLGFVANLTLTNKRLAEPKTKLIHIE